MWTTLAATNQKEFFCQKGLRRSGTCRTQRVAIRSFTRNAGRPPIHCPDLAKFVSFSDGWDSRLFPPLYFFHVVSPLLCVQHRILCNKRHDGRRNRRVLLLPPGARHRRR
mmetsp:Transcript_14623/g.16865  ORF Transcript_14623/g.16865 Transcript_14623/m.16865 type:complete len:110 (-) Transcript_14623:1872-2201(-)